jgi:hypothetical protein
VTHKPIRVMADGSRIYSDYHRYKPVPAHQRKNAVRKPRDPRAVRYNGSWFLPLELVPEGRREMPETRPDSDALDHWAGCQCDVCQRPQATILWRRRAKNQARAKKNRGDATP